MFVALFVWITPINVDVSLVIRVADFNNCLYPLMVKDL